VHSQSWRVMLRCLVALRLHDLCVDRNSIPSIAEMQSFIAQGADVNTKGWDGDTVLIAATRYLYLDAVKTFLAAEGIDINAKNDGE
jgi:ankyrin repeat protein